MSKWIFAAVVIPIWQGGVRKCCVLFWRMIKRIMRDRVGIDKRSN
jgi:hypothetical protein